MKKLSLIGIIIGAALLTAAPVSIRSSPNSVVPSVTVDKAEARYGVYRRHYRRVYRRAYRRAYYGYGYGYGYPGYYYGLYPSYYGYGYRPWRRRWWW